jgi:hypothetical protein
MLISFSFAYGLVIDIGFEIDKEDNVRLNNLDIGEGEPQRFFSDANGSYEVLIVDSDGNKLEGTKFDASFWLLSDPPEALDYSDHSYRFKYQNASDKVLIKYRNNIIFKSKLPPVGNCTENGVCEKGENAFGCFRDCDSSSSDGYCSGFVDSICDPDCLANEDEDCVPSSSTEPSTTCAPIFGLIFLSIIAFVCRFERCKQW